MTAFKEQYKNKKKENQQRKITFLAHTTETLCDDLEIIVDSGCN